MKYLTALYDLRGHEPNSSYMGRRNSVPYLIKENKTGILGTWSEKRHSMIYLGNSDSFRENSVQG